MATEAVVNEKREGELLINKNEIFLTLLLFVVFF